MFGYLHIPQGDLTGKKNILIEGPITVGRDPGNDIVLPHQGISRKHVKFSKKAGDFFVEDMGSHNGTSVNGRLIQKSRLSSEDVIHIGETHFFFKILDHQLTEEEQLMNKDELFGAFPSTSTSYFNVNDFKKEELEQLRENKPNSENPWK